MRHGARGPVKRRATGKGRQKIRYILVDGWNDAGAEEWRRDRGENVALKPELDRLICIYIISTVFHASRMALEGRKAQGAFLVPLREKGAGWG